MAATLSIAGAPAAFGSGSTSRRAAISSSIPSVSLPLSRAPPLPSARASPSPPPHSMPCERRRSTRRAAAAAAPSPRPLATTPPRAAVQQEAQTGPVAAVDEDGNVVAPRPWKPEAEVPGMTAYLDSLRWGKDGLLPAIAQNVDTGELLMQAYSDRAAVCETLQTGLATFYSRSRAGRWCKGETSGAYIRVLSVHADCDRDSLVYLGDPIGPACHTGARTCWFTRAGVLPAEGDDEDGAAAAAASAAAVHDEGDCARHGAGAPLTTLLALERTIAERRREAEEAEAEAAAGPSSSSSSPSSEPKKKPSWTARLLADEALLCKKVREEAGELCETLERGEGPERAASEAADLLYHAMVVLNAQGVPIGDVMRVLRRRFGVSGVEEKAARPPKKQG